MTSACPSEPTLARMLDDLLVGEEAETVEAHVAACLDCQRTLERLTDAEDRETDASWSPGPDEALPSLTVSRLITKPGRTEFGAEPPPASTSEFPEIGGYTIEGELGRGGMGVVYRARQVRANRDVALKMVLSGDRGRPEDLLRFRLEAESLARLHHPNIVQVYEVGSAGGRPFFSMEYVAGGTLVDAMAGGPRPHAEAAATTEILARAMHAAHQSGVVHRDLKPANVLLERPGRDSTRSAAVAVPKITDFGLAKVIGEDSGLTRTGQVMGTPSYMAPEQASGGSPVGVPADVYSLGAILYELLTGRPPFKGASPWETMMQVVHEPAAPPSRWRPGVSRDLDVVCLKCLAKEPASRYASADALAEDLRRHLAGEPILARPSGAIRRIGLWTRRRPGLAALAGLLLASTFAGATGVVVQWRRAEAGLAESRANFILARRAVDDLFTRISENKLVAQPGLQGLRRELLESAAAYYRDFAGRKIDDPDVRVETVLARTRLGEIDLAIAAPVRAEEELRAALAASGEAPRPPVLELARAGALASLAKLLLLGSKPDDALRTVDQSIDSARSLANAGLGVKPGRLEADDLVLRANILGRLMRAGEQERNLREAVRRLADLDRDHPGGLDVHRGQAEAFQQLADALSRQPGRGKDTLAAYDEAARHYRAAADGPKARLEDRSGFAITEVGRGNYLGFVLQRWDDAQAALESARKPLEALAAENPLVSSFRRQLLDVYYLRGYMEVRHARYREASAFYEKAETLLDGLIRDVPDGRVRYALERGSLLIEFADIRRNLGDPLGAVSILRDRCIPAAESASNAAPSLTRLRLMHAMAHRYLSLAHLDADDPSSAVQAARSAETLLGPIARSADADALHREELARISMALGDSLRATDSGTEAEGAFSRAIAILESLYKADPKAPDRADALALALARRASLRRDADPKLARADASRARSLLETPTTNTPDGLVHLAVARVVEGLPPERAIEALRRAVAANLSAPAALRADPDLAPLRPLPEFTRLVEQVESRSREARKDVAKP